MRIPFFRNKPGATSAATPADDAAVQAARAAARRRLVGALVLLLVGVVGFPLLFETQPRPLPANTPIYLPEGTPARANNPAPVPRPVTVVPPDAGTEAVVASLPASAAAVAPVPTSAASVAPQAPQPRLAPVVATPPKPAPTPAPPVSPADSGRFVVQVGAYNDAERMKAARQKVEKLGYKSYTQDVSTPDGKRTRVRAGPFGTRQEADSAANKLKAAGLQANVLSL